MERLKAKAMRGFVGWKGISLQATHAVLLNRWDGLGM